MNSVAASTVAKYDPALAVELFNACCVREPGPSTRSLLDSDESVGFATTYNLPFFPSSPFHPGINSFFERSFEEGLDLVANLVEYAVETWLSQYEETGVGLSITWGEEEKFFAGDRNVYHWLDGSAMGSYALQSLLLTLERRLLETEDKDELQRRTALVLSRATNLALLSVLVSVAKAHNELFVTLLGPLLFSEAIDQWDIEATNSNSWQLIGGFAPRAEWWRDQDEQFCYSRLEHRLNLLRAFNVLYLWNGDQQVVQRARKRWLALAENADPDQAQVLRILAAIYDRENLRAEPLPGGGVQISVDLPPLLASAARDVQDEALANSRAIGISYLAERILSNESYEEADELFDDLERVLAHNDLFGQRPSKEIVAWLVFLKAAEASFTTRAGGPGACRTQLLNLIGARLDQGDSRPTFDDQSHWTTLVGSHAASVFGKFPDGPESRKAIIAFLQCCSGFSLHRLVQSLLSLERGAGMSALVLDISRVWSVEVVRRAQVRGNAENSWTMVPSAVDLDFNDRAQKFIRTGDWPISDRLAMGRPDPSSSVAERWPPSAYEVVVPGLLELLERTRDAAIVGATVPILNDVLEALHWRSEDNEYDQRRVVAWDLIGAALPNLPDVAQDVVISAWVPEALTEHEEALDAVIALLRSYSRGSATLEATSCSFSHLIKALETVAVRTPHAFYRHCFGCSDRGLELRWEEAQATQWVARHRTFYEQTLAKLTVGGVSESLARRLLRPEFRQIDEAVFDALTRDANALLNIRGEAASSLAELMIPFGRLVRNNPARRRRWRRLLAELEKVGERLAWQILAEVADRV